MQWSADRNGGFSRANPQALYLPPIMDPVYGFQSVNVEAQQNEASSLLNWTRRMIGVRKQHKSFGRGSFSFLYPRNRKILAYIRSFEGERILCTANLSRQAQAVELDLSEHRGAVPIELTGGAAFPPIGDLPYMLSLPAYGFFWFRLTDEADAPRWHVSTPDPLPEFVTLTAPGGRIDRALEGRELHNLERYALPEFLNRQRWFAGKGNRIRQVRVKPLGSIPGEPNALALAEVETTEEAQRYFLPLSILWGEQNLTFGAPKLSYTLAKVRYGPVLGALIDAAYDERFLSDLIRRMRQGGELPLTAGTLRFIGSAAFRDVDIAGEARPVGAEQSNVSVIVADSVLLKIYRRVREGEQPEIEVARFLTEAGFRGTPAFYGSVEYMPEEGAPIGLAAAFAFVRNQGDVWTVTLDALERDLDEFALLSHSPAEEQQEGVSLAAEPAALGAPDFNYPLNIAGLLGRRTAEMHAAFAAPTDGAAFRAEPIQDDDIHRWVAMALQEAKRGLALLRQREGDLSDDARADVSALLSRQEALFARIEAFARLPPSGLKTRIHGDYHLGQALVAQDDVMVIDFEGEPQRPLAERREKSSGLRDVAGMLRSFDYAAWSALDRLRARHGQIEERVGSRAFAWRDKAISDFLRAYWPVADAAGILPQDAGARDSLLELFRLQKAFYEVSYEAANRPSWLPIPIRGLIDLIATPRQE
jgi:maltose alpha-D-glucosyltransferase/alpha-amylase